MKYMPVIIRSLGIAGVALALGGCGYLFGDHQYRRKRRGQQQQRRKRRGLIARVMAWMKNQQHIRR